MKNIGKNGVSILVLICLCVMLVFSISNTATAASYSQKTLACPRCRQVNRSYGYDPNRSSRTVSLNSGKYCNPCRETIPDGEYHMYLYTRDLYYFRCDSSSCRRLSMNNRVYTNYYDNPVSEHYTNGKRDY